jgi:hypothetical protein
MKVQRNTRDAPTTADGAVCGASNYAAMQCNGLDQDRNARSSEDCATNCCGNQRCNTWQWSDQKNECWQGTILDYKEVCTVDGEWVGGAKAAAITTTTTTTIAVATTSTSVATCNGKPDPEMCELVTVDFCTDGGEYTADIRAGHGARFLT